ncbi:MAG TPA: dipicolinate synthase subunit B [Clostridiales bacterium]|jgi:dipicolinate synthase subunit B|nr:dipicolinate synthase subunit B [Clostridiales bacterium]
MNKPTAGLGLTGSFCTFSTLIEELPVICGQFRVIPVLSATAAKTDTRFGKAEDWIRTLEEITGEKVRTEITETEPFGPRKILDIMIIAPCTGNTLAKLAWGITDTSVTMAAKSHLRNGGPLLLAPSTNDALGAAAKNIGMLLNQKNVYFVPFFQDNCQSKPRSMVASMPHILPAALAALEGVQLEPIILPPT